MMDDLTTIDDNMSVRSESVGGRSPPSLSPVVSVSNSGSPNSPPPPLLSGPQMMSAGHLSGHHTPPIFHTSSPSSRPPFLPSLYFPHAYNSPPPIHTSDPTANDCKLVEYRGQKVAAFIINQDTMLCLPQAFELFLKNLVGGLHTVYTKLKRLGIEPLVCNVEQVRVLRGLGAIQPGVNRCKLLCIKHFDVLYKDCTTARRDRLSSLLHDRFENQVICFSHTHRRPGRPPKRPHEIMGPLQMTGPMPHGAIPSHISPEALMALKKSRMDGRDFPHFMNGGSTPMDNEMEKSPLLSNGYNPPPKALMAQYMALNGGLPHPALFAHSGLPIPPPPGNPWPQHHQQDNPFKVGPPPQDQLTRYMLWENCRMSCDEVIKHLERMRDDRSRNDRMIGLPDRDDSLERPRSMSPSHSRSRSRTPSPHKANGYGDNDVLNLSKAESRDDLSDSGHPGLVTSDHSPIHDPQDDKDDILSDNDDFDDKIDLSDHDDYEYPSRSLHVGLSSETSNNNNISAMNNNSSLLSAVGNITINKNLTESLSSHSNSSNLSSNCNLTSNTASGLLTTADDRIPQVTGLNLSNSLMNLSMSLAAHTNALQHNPLTNGNAYPLVGSATNGDRGSGDGMLGSIGSPSTASTPVGIPTPQPPLSSLENLLGNIQNLLKVAAESVRHEEKQWYREKEHFKIEFIRLKEIREKLEKQLMEDEKLKVLYQRKLKKEKRARRRLEEQLTDKMKRLSHYESNTKDNILALRNSECFSSESVQSAVAAAAAAAAVANAVSAASTSNNTITSSTLSRGMSNCNIPDNGSRMSPKPQKDLDQSQSDQTSLYFNKPMLFNCTV